MTTYLVLNVVVVALLVAGIPLSRWRPSRRWAYALGSLLLMTAVFDNVIVGLGIVSYDPALILGIRVFKAPIEDFLYAVGAMVVVPAVWTDLEKKQ